MLVQALANLVQGPSFWRGDLDTLACLLIWMSQSPKEMTCVEMFCFCFCFKPYSIQRVESMIIHFP